MAQPQVVLLGRERREQLQNLAKQDLVFLIVFMWETRNREGGQCWVLAYSVEECWYQQQKWGIGRSLKGNMNSTYWT